MSASVRREALFYVVGFVDGLYTATVAVLCALFSVCGLRDP